MTEPLFRTAWESPLHEIVDDQIRAAGRSDVNRRQLLRARLSPALSLGGLVIVVALLSNSDRTWAYIGAFSCTAALLAVVTYWVTDVYYRRATKRYYRRLVHETYGDTPSYRFELEVRRAGLWTRFQDAETVFPWNQLGEVVDGDHGVELSLKHGVLLVRNRGFASAEDRRRFVTQVRELSAGKCDVEERSSGEPATDAL